MAPEKPTTTEAVSTPEKQPEAFNFQEEIKGLKTETQKIEAYREMWLEKVMRNNAIVSKIGNEKFIELLEALKSEYTEWWEKDDFLVMHTNILLLNTYFKEKKYINAMVAYEWAILNKDFKKVQLDTGLHIYKFLYQIYKEKNNPKWEEYFEEWAKLRKEYDKWYIEYMRNLTFEDRKNK